MLLEKTFKLQISETFNLQTIKLLNCKLLNCIQTVICCYDLRLFKLIWDYSQMNQMKTETSLTDLNHLIILMVPSDFFQ